MPETITCARTFIRRGIRRGCNCPCCHKRHHARPLSVTLATIRFLEQLLREHGHDTFNLSKHPDYRVKGGSGVSSLKHVGFVRQVRRRSSDWQITDIFDLFLLRFLSVPIRTWIYRDAILYRTDEELYLDQITDPCFDIRQARSKAEIPQGVIDGIEFDPTNKYDPSTPLVLARHLADHKIETFGETECQVCLCRFADNVFAFNEDHAQFLFTMFGEHRFDWVHVPRVYSERFPIVRGGELARLRHWGLLEEQESQNEKKAHAGFYRCARIVPDVLDGRMQIPSTLSVRRGNTPILGGPSIIVPRLLSGTRRIA
jgi:hypothetical protein